MIISDYLPSVKNRDDYQKDNFSKFLKKVSFSYHIPSIHIAGTNGKGSTATYIARIYQEAGYKVGLYTSPYFYECNEMIEINGEYIKDFEIKKYIDDNRKLIEKYSLSEFEIETFIALSYFKDQKVDVAIIECGMGGEIDATNIFEPILSIITTISLEHTMYLGKSISEIAYQKAGIIKQDIPSLIGELDKEAETAISEVAYEQDSTLYKVGTTYDIKPLDDGISFSYHNYKDIVLSSNAEYSCYDASIAIEAVNILYSQFDISEENIRNGLRNAKLSSRMEVVFINPTVIVDGAHNVEAITKLANSISLKYQKRVHVIFSCFLDKNLALMLPQINLVSDDISLTTFNHPRARKEEDYFLFLEEYKFYEDHIKLIQDKMNEFKDDIILITGSLAFASLVRKEFLEGQYHVEVLAQE